MRLLANDGAGNRRIGSCGRYPGGRSEFGGNIDELINCSDRLGLLTGAGIYNGQIPGSIRTGLVFLK